MHHKQSQRLQSYFDQGFKKVIVAAPAEGTLNLVYGVNHGNYRPEEHHLVTAASCTTNCLAPIIKVMHEKIGIVFAINSALHSYLILAYSDHDRVAMSVGIYYMSNAAGRLAGTLLSGWAYQSYGLEGCLWWSAGFVAMAAVISMGLPKLESRKNGLRFRPCHLIDWLWAKKRGQHLLAPTSSTTEE